MASLKDMVGRKGMFGALANKLYGPSGLANAMSSGQGREQIAQRLGSMPGSEGAGGIVRNPLRRLARFRSALQPQDDTTQSLESGGRIKKRGVARKTARGSGRR